MRNGLVLVIVGWLVYLFTTGRLVPLIQAALPTGASFQSVQSNGLPSTQGVPQTWLSRLGL